MAQCLRTSSSIREAGAWRKERRLASLDHFVVKLSSVQGTASSLKPKDLLDACPFLSEPVIEIRATDDLTVFQPPMTFVPGLSFLPPPTIRSAVFKQIRASFSERRLVVLRDQHLLPRKPMHLCTQLALRVHGIQAEDASFDQGWREERFERADLILLFADTALPENRASDHVIPTQQMNRMALGAGGSQGFAKSAQAGHDRDDSDSSEGGWVRFHSEVSLPNE